MAFTIDTNDLAPTTAEELVSGTTLAFSPTAAVTVDKLAVLLAVWDNVNTDNAESTTFLSASDSKGNTWIRAAEAQYSAGGILDGVLASVLFATITTQIETTDIITITSIANGTAKGAALVTFNRDTALNVKVAGAAYQRVAASDAYSVSVSGLPSEEHLWIGLNAMEANANDVNDRDAAFSAITQGGVGVFGTTTTPSNLNAGARAGYLIATDSGQTYDRASLLTADRVTILVAFKEVPPPGWTDVAPRHSIVA